MLSPLYIYLSNLFSRNDSRVCWCFTMSSHLSFHFSLPPPLFPSIDGHGRVYKRSITVPASLRSLLLCLFISKVFNLSFEKYYFRIIFFLCSRMKNSLINTILIPVLELHWNIIRIVFTKIWKLIKNFLGKY